MIQYLKDVFLPAIILIPEFLINFDFCYVENLDTSEFSARKCL